MVPGLWEVEGLQGEQSLALEHYQTGKEQMGVKGATLGSLGTWGQCTPQTYQTQRVLS